MYRAIVGAVARRRYKSGLAALERGDLDAFLAYFNDDLEFAFSGDSPLGTNLHSKRALRLWCERFHRLLPSPRFELQDVVVEGWPWDLTMAIRASIRSTVLGEPYRNEFGQFLRLRNLKVTKDFVIEDTQRFERLCRRLVAAGIAEAGADPITDRSAGP
jgi:ketosteroid isomerase-like protein